MDEGGPAHDAPEQERLSPQMVGFSNHHLIRAPVVSQCFCMVSFEHYLRLSHPSPKRLPQSTLNFSLIGTIGVSHLLLSIAYRDLSQFGSYSFFRGST